MTTAYLFTRILVIEVIIIIIIIHGTVPILFDTTNTHKH